MSITRRDTLKLMAGSGLALAAPVGFERVLRAASPPDLAVINGIDPVKNTQAAVAALGGIGRFVKKGDKVVIKPNIGFGNEPDKATTTEPAVVRTLAKMALEAGAKRVLVLDNPCHRADIALEICGMKKAVEGLDNAFIFTITKESMFKKVKIPKAKQLLKAEVAKDILEADCIINVPVAKSHGGARVSFSMKNWMGVVYDRKFWHARLNLHQAIADMATFIKPKLIVLDATRALVTGGPGGPGEVAKLNTIVAGTDPVAIDAYGVGLADWDHKGYKATDIPYIMMAAEHGVGTYDLAKLTIQKQTV